MARKTEERPCPRCDGSGTCVDCQGTGKARCPACEGEGVRVSPRGQSSPCRTCGGTGHIDCSPQCPSCNGSGVITAEFQKEIQSKYAMQAANLTPSNRAVSVLVAVNVGLYLLTTHDFPSSLVPQPYPWLIWGAMINTPSSLQDGQIWRFLTPAFLHAGWWHVGMNMAFLMSMGPAIEGIYGLPRFLLLYFLAALGGDVASWLFNPVPGVGASGALFGVGAAYLGLRWRWGYFDDATAHRLLYALGGLLVIGFLTSGTFLPIRLDNWGHLGGAVAGLAYSYLGPRPRGH